MPILIGGIGQQVPHQTQPKLPNIQNQADKANSQTNSIRVDSLKACNIHQRPVAVLQQATSHKSTAAQQPAGQGIRGPKSTR